jgi:hypothetical protein
MGAYQGGERVEEDDGEHGLGHHGEQLVVEAVYIAELHFPLGDPQSPHELHAPPPVASVSESRERPETTGGNETLAGTGFGGGPREAHLVHDVRVGLQRDPPLPHLHGARRRKSKAGGERTGRRRGGGIE